MCNTHCWVTLAPVTSSDPDNWTKGHDPVSSRHLLTHGSYQQISAVLSSAGVYLSLWAHAWRVTKATEAKNYCSLLFCVQLVTLTGFRDIWTSPEGPVSHPPQELFLDIYLLTLGAVLGNTDIASSDLSVQSKCHILRIPEWLLLLLMRKYLIARWAL